MSVLLLILKILLYIILAVLGVVLGIVLIVLILPVSAEAGFVDKKLTYKLRYWFINMYDSDGKGLIPWFMEWRKKREEKKRKKAESKPPAEALPAEVPTEENIPEVTAEETAQVEEVTEAEVTENVTEETPPEEPTEEEVDQEKEKSDQEFEEKLESIVSKIEFGLDIWRAADRPLLKIFKSFKFSEIYIDFIIANEDAYKCALNYGRISGAVYWALGWLSTLCNVKFRTVDINAGFALTESRWDVSGRLSFRLIDLVIAGLWFLVTYLTKYFIPYKLKERKKKKAAEKAEKIAARQK